MSQHESPKPENIQPLVPDANVSEKARRRVDTYTIETRKSIEDPAEPMGFSGRMIRKFEGINREVWYKLFKRVFNNAHSFDRIPISELKSVFIIPCGEAIGDMIVTIPLFRAIKRRNPNCKIGTLISHRNETLLRCEDTIDEKYMYRDRLDILHYPEIARARKVGYQVVLNMHLNRMTEYGLLSNIISPKGIKLATTHKRKELYGQLFNCITPYRRNSLYFSQLGLQLLSFAIDFETPIKQWETRPTLTICQDVRARTEAKIREHLQELNATWFIYFNTQARVPFREWGTANTAEFSRRFAVRYPDGAIFFTASPVRQNEVKKEIDAEVFKRAKFFDTSYDLLEVAVLAEQSRLVITPDTSVIHFGTAMLRPTLVMWTDRTYLPMEWIPQQVPSRNLVPKVLGQPVSTIPVDEVWEAACELLDGTWTTSQTSYERNRPNAEIYQATAANRNVQDLVQEVLVEDIDDTFQLPEWLRFPSKAT